MTYLNKKLIRRKIEEEHWELLSHVCKLPLPRTPVSLLYANRDGEICECLAEYVLDPFFENWWRGISPPVKGNRIMTPIAWKTIQVQKTDRTFIVTEWCNKCGNEIEMRWDTDTRGFQAFCPVCGKRLMLCDECQHAPDGGKCDYSSESDSCWRRGGHKNE